MKTDTKSNVTGIFSWMEGKKIIKTNFFFIGQCKLQIFTCFLSLVTFNLFSQNTSLPITTDNSTLTNTQLINDVLIGNICSSVTNVNSPINSTVGGESFNSIGYFNAANADFPFEEGISLTTSNMSLIPGPNNTTVTLDEGFSPNWVGDGDIATLSQTSFFDTFNASVLEFDFIPTSNKISFRYLLASEEYEQDYPCNFADTFAFILSGPGIANTNSYDHDANPATPEINLDLGGKNIALIPGTNIPVSVTNVHNLTTCPSGEIGTVALPEYFDTVFSGNGATAFNGQTVVLTAEATVVPNQSYHIKLVIADNLDQILDSAVFLEAGSFNLGPKATDQFICDNNNDGFWDFDFLSLNTDLLDTLNPADFSVSYHGSEADAIADTNPLPNIYTNSVAYTTESIFVRIENNLLAACYDVTSFTINVADNPSANTIIDQVFCDTNDDGFLNFDINALSPIALGSQNPASFNISYHSSQADADAGTNMLSSPYTNTTPFTAETIFVRIENKTNTDCIAANSNFTIEVIRNPTINPVPDQLICDDDNDGFWNFDFKAIDPIILGNQNPANFDITYYDSQANADKRINKLPTPYTNGTAFTAETIYLRIENNISTSCFNTNSFIIDVSAGSMANTIPDQVFCDDNNDGFLNFDFNALNPIGLGTQNPSNFNISYHSSQADADAGTNMLSSPYTNTTPFTAETIFVRVIKNSGTNCKAATSSFSINVINDPTANAIPEQIICDDNDDGFWSFDLNALNPIVLGSQNPENFSISYHSSQANADTGVSILSNPYVNTTPFTAETIFVRIHNNNNINCYATTSFTILVEQSPIANTIPDQIYCDTNNDGFGSFDLNALNTFILGSQNPTNFNITYHNSQTDANTSTNPLRSPYINASAFIIETIYVNISNLTKNCYETTSFNIGSYKIPDTNPVTDYIVCSDPPNLYTFDFSTKNLEITGTEPNLSVSYHESLEDALLNKNPLSIPYTTFSRTIFVRSENTLSGCANTDMAFELIINKNPSVDIPDQSICLENLPVNVIANPITLGNTFLWSTGETTPGINITTGGTYSVTVTTPEGCSATDDFIITVPTKGIIEFTENIDYSNINNIKVTIDSNDNNNEYLYSIDDGPLQVSNLFENVTFGYHSFTITNPNTCNSITKEILVIYFPKYMTPNGDNRNDSWHILGKDAIQQTMIRIYDRKGKLLKHITASSSGWDGTYNGKRMPSTDYWYVANVITREKTFEVIGHFALKN